MAWEVGGQSYKKVKEANMNAPVLELGSPFCNIKRGKRSPRSVTSPSTSVGSPIRCFLWRSDICAWLADPCMIEPPFTRGPRVASARASNQQRGMSAGVAVHLPVPKQPCPVGGYPRSWRRCSSSTYFSRCLLSLMQPGKQSAASPASQYSMLQSGLAGWAIFLPK